MWRPKYFSVSSLPQKNPKNVVTHRQRDYSFCFATSTFSTFYYIYYILLSTDTTLNSSSITNISILKSHSSSHRSSHRKHFLSVVVMKPGGSCWQLPLKAQEGDKEENRKWIWAWLLIKRFAYVTVAEALSELYCIFILREGVSV